MKKITLLLVAFTYLTAFAQTPCVNGFAGDYPCSGYDLQSQIPFTEMGATNANDSWGWTDPQDGKEYAIIGLDNGTAFIDISTPTAPIYLGKLPSETGTATGRDIKTYNNFAFVVSDNNGPHGMQIFDLTRLRDVTNPPETFTEDVLYSNFTNSHNLAINEDTGFAYALRTNTFNGGAHFIDIQDPLNPVAVGGYSDIFSHDAQVVTYNGPDADYTGQEILLSFNGFDQTVTIVNVTDKANPQEIALFTYTNNEHAHQGWLTEDQKHLIIGDESDELNLGINSRTIIFDLTDLDNPVESFTYSGDSGASDHNGYVLGDQYFLANYSAGMRVIDISDIENQNMTETGYFDVYPPNNSAGFNGAWSVYPYFESRNIVVSAISFSDPNYTGGFFLLKETTLGIEDNSLNNLISVQPNPASSVINIQANDGLIVKSVKIYDTTGRLVKSEAIINQSINIASVASSILFVEIETNKGTITKKIIKQ